jgi:hypothetical protein
MENVQSAVGTYPEDDSRALTRPSRPDRHPAGRSRHWLDAGASVPRRRWIIVPIAVFAVVIMLVSSLPAQIASYSRNSGLTTDSAPAPPVPTFYPYLVPTSEYPQPDNLNSSSTGFGYQDPQVVSTVVGGVPTFYMASSTEAVTCNWDQIKVLCPGLIVSTGTYSSQLALSILNGTGGRHVPIEWSTPVEVWSSLSAGVIDGVAITANAAGSFMLLAVGTSEDGTLVFQYQSSSGSWVSASPGSVSGAYPQFSFGGAAALLVTSTSTHIYATTYYESGVTSASQSIYIQNSDDAPFWTPSAGMGDEGIAVSTPSNTIDLETSADGGHTFVQTQIGSFTPIPSQSPLDSVGSTVLSNPGGWPGQMAATTDGNTSMILYSTYMNDEVSLAALTSVDNGAVWTGPENVPPTAGEMAYPTLTESGTGYIYAAWEEGSLGNWSIDQAVFSSEGLMIQPPGKVSAALFAWGPPSIAVDAFQRPLIVWPYWSPQPCINFNCAEVEYTGAFLPATQAVGFLEAQSDELSSWDFESGGDSSFVSTVSTLASRTLANISSYEAHPSSTVLCNAIAGAGNGLYANVTHILIANGSSPEGCGKTLAYLLTFNRVPRGGWPEGTQGENTTSPSKVLPTLGPLTGNSFLAVEADWVLEALSLPINYTADPDRPYIPGVGLANLPTPVIGHPTADGASGNITVLPEPNNPTTATLAVQTGTFPSYIASWESGEESCPKYGGADYPNIFEESWGAVKFYSNISVEGSSTSSFASASGLPSVFLTNLTPNATSSWQAAYGAAYSGESWVTVCNIREGPYSNSTRYSSSWPTSLTQNLAGSVTTTERVIGARAVYFQSSGDIYTYWNNTMPASASAALWKGTTRSTQIYSTSGFRVPDEFGWSGIADSTYYNLSLSTASQTGAWNSTELPASSASQVFTSPALDSGYSCLFETQSSSISMWGATYTNLNGGNVTVHWFSSPAGGQAWLSYFADGTGVNLTQTAYTDQSWSNGTVEWASEIHGLYQGTIIEVRVFSAFTTGCYTDEASTGFVIDTDNGFALTEVDNPYDSISQTGGGATLYWTLWAPIPKSDFLGGTILLWNDTSESQLASQNISSLWVTSQYYSGDYGANITPCNLNQKYSVQVFLNFTYNGLHTTVQSSVGTFTYEKDTTGDGLTDAEKTRGWYVPVASAFGGKSNGNGSTWVQADPNLWATNGLVNDYVEKEYDLDPQTVDTAGSHMLDTWNLTFNMGTNNHTCPVEFQCWFENSTNPLPSGYIGNGSATNFSATGPSSEGDTYSWAAKVLWAKSDLGVLQSLITTEGVGWLRAETGTDGSVSTLTVWGKLSWGANPLVASTINDGIADGSRVNPISTVGVQFSRVFGNASGALAHGAGYAMKMTVYNGTGTSGTLELSNYSAQALIDESDISNYSVIFPVPQPYQFVTVKVQVIADNNSVLSPMWLDATATSFTETIDLAGTAVASFSYNGNLFHTYWGQISGKIQPAWTGNKVPTWLWLPDDNSTVNGLPAGLERYTGEQSFELVVVNASSSISSQPVPLPWGGYASSPITVSRGLNDFLIPREQFLASTMGQALFRGYAPYNSTNPIPPLVGSYGQGVISKFNGGNWMIDLGAYWQNRAINNGGTGNITPSTETGTNDSSVWNVQIVAVKSPTSNNTGSVPSVVGLYNTSDTPAAVQSIATLNVTNQTNLDLLIAALYDNTSGGSNAVNGTFAPVTFIVGSLNLLPAVISAIPNVALVGDGLYGAPVSVPPPPSTNEWGSFWNAVTSVIENPLGAILSLETIVWSASVAAMTYLNHLAREAAALGGAFLERAAGALVSVGKALLSALSLLFTWIVELLKALFNPPIQAIDATMSSYLNSVWSTLQPLWSELNNSQNPSSSQSMGFFNVVFGAPFVIALIISGLVATALMILQALSLGAGFLITALLSIITSETVATIVHGLSSWSPIPLISSAMVGTVWSLYNLTDGGLHAMTLSNTSSAAFALLSGLAGIALTAYQSGQDSDFAVQALNAAQRVLTGPKSVNVVIFSIVNLAMDFVANLIGTAVLLWESAGLKAQILNIIGLVLSGVSLFISSIALVWEPLAAPLRAGGMYSMVETGLGLSVLGMFLNFAGYLLGQ